MALYTYTATKNGVLANPYRFVKAGEVVTSEVEIKASWLKDGFAPLDEKKPLFGYMAEQEKQSSKASKAKPIKDDADAKDAAKEKSGTANQDVI